MTRGPLFDADYIALFSGHQTFPLRYGWLKKAYDAVKRREAPTTAIFRDKSAIAEFGVGKNMVGAMRHWATCCGVIAEVSRTGLATTPLGDLLFGQPGVDPYLQEPASLWLLHWHLCSWSKCRPSKTTWYWVFNKFAGATFARSDLTAGLLKVARARGWPRVSHTTVQRDVECFVRTYEVTETLDQATIEASLECPLAELGLIRTVEKQHYLVRGPKPSLPTSVFAYALNQFWRSQGAANTMSFERIAHEPGSPGRVFLLDETDLAERVLSLEDLTRGQFLWSETTGLKQVLRPKLIDDEAALTLVSETYHAAHRA